MRKEVHKFVHTIKNKFSKDSSPHLPFPLKALPSGKAHGEGLAYLGEVVLQLEITMSLIQLGSGRAENLGSQPSRPRFELYFFCLPAFNLG